jgi:hypothetical protein
LLPLFDCCDFRKLEIIPLDVGFIGVLFIASFSKIDQLVHLLKGGTHSYREHTDTIIFISGRNERRLKIDASATSHIQAAFVAKAFTWAVYTGIKVSGA